MTQNHPDQALSLSVHSLPQSIPATNTRMGRLKMLPVLLVCAAPVVASYITYYWVRPEGRRNYGELIAPQRPVPAALAQLKGQWLLVSVAGGDCNETCKNNLYWQRQLRESLGKEKDRLDRVWLVDDQASVPASLQPALTQATVLRASREQLDQWLAPEPGQQLANHIYVVDPLGNWMMRFPANMDMAGAAKGKRDLERLMRASSSWDRPGR